MLTNLSWVWTRRSGASVAVAGAGLAVALAASAVLAGCYVPGGQRRTGGAETYQSLTWAPQVVQLVDTRDGTMLWEYKVPVGQQMVLKFADKATSERDKGYDANFPDVMKWAVMPVGQKSGPLENSVAAPPWHARMIITEQYEAPALPEGYEPLNPQASASAEGSGTGA